MNMTTVILSPMSENLECRRTEVRDKRIEVEGDLMRDSTT